MIYDLVTIGSITKDNFLLTDRGKIFKTPKDKLAPAWLGFELGEKICIESLITRIGGVAASVAIGTKKLGLISAPLGTIGKDEEGSWILGELKKERLETKLIKTAPGRKSPVSTLIVDKNSAERVIFYEKTSGEIDLSFLDKIKAKNLFVSSLTGNCPKNIDHILKYVKRIGAGLAAAPSTSQIRTDLRNLKRLLSSSEILFLNKNEAIEIAFQEKKKFVDIKNLMNFLHGLGPKIICITDGAKGAWASDGKAIIYSPIMKVNAVEMTGAGDAFAAAFLGFHLKREPLRSCLKAAIINSASVVQFVGTTRGLLTKKDIIKKICSFK